MIRFFGKVGHLFFFLICTLTYHNIKIRIRANSCDEFVKGILDKEEDDILEDPQLFGFMIDDDQQ